MGEWVAAPERSPRILREAPSDFVIFDRKSKGSEKKREDAPREIASIYLFI